MLGGPKRTGAHIPLARAVGRLLAYWAHPRPGRNYQGMRDVTGNDDTEYQSLLADEGANCQITYVSSGKPSMPGIPRDRQRRVEKAAQEFLRESGGDICILLAGRLQSDAGDEEYSTENAVADRCRSELGDPGREDYNKATTVDLVLDTLGGSLDSAFKTVLFLSRFTSNLRVFVPRRAKSAGTLVAIGAQKLYMTPFSELGPLDTQIRDPRNPTETLSALDCYKSVDYVRDFGLSTLKRALMFLAKEMNTGVPLSDLLDSASEFANASTGPMLAHINALDFGGWGRTLNIGEMYTKSLLARVGYENPRSRSIATKLVYGYTHHPFPIDIDEARDIGLAVEPMKPALSVPALEMVMRCADLNLDIAVGAWKAGKKTEAAGPEPDGEDMRGAKTESHARQRSEDGSNPRDAEKGDDELVTDHKQPMAVVNPVHYGRGRAQATRTGKTSTAEPPDSPSAN